jgi:diacylglycerol O-acyltransferase / wax synthase
MEKRSYERLSGQEHSFLVMENANLPMHVGAVQIFEGGSLRTPDGGLNVGLYKHATESLLHLVPRYRQKLMWVPIQNWPVWVDDPHFNLDYHIRHTALPRPGGDEQLRRLVARIGAQQLDRSRPLWETWVVEGLQGDRFAVIMKVHHCMIDGIAGMALTQILLSPTPDYEIHEAPPFVPHTAPSGRELLRDALVRWASLPFQVVRGWQHFRGHTANLARELRFRARALADVASIAVQTVPGTPLNGSIGPHRRFDSLSMPLGHFKALSKAVDCTVNDVVLATVAGAVREFLMSRGVRPDETDFRASAPVNVRSREERGLIGNRASTWILDLPIGEADPRKRLAAIHQATQDRKKSKQALGLDMMMTLAEWTPSVLLSLSNHAVSFAVNMHAFGVHMYVTNIPGPQIPLYLLGAKMLQMYPWAPLAPGVGVSVGLISYNGKMCWGFNADYELVPDLRKFVEMIDAAFQELARAAGVDLAPAAAGPEVSELRAGTRARRLKRTLPNAPSTEYS